MTNKRVEKLFREEKCLRDSDIVKVEFLYSECTTEVYKVDVTISSGYSCWICEYRVVIQNDVTASINLIIEWNSAEGRPIVDYELFYSY